MSDETAGSDRHEPQLTDHEKALRDWLRTQPHGGEWWMVVKAGFRRSYQLGVEAAAKDGVARLGEWLLKIDLPSGGGGPAPATGPDDEWLLVEDEDGAPYPEHVQAALRRIYNHLLAVDGSPSLLTIERMAPVLLELLPDPVVVPTPPDCTCDVFDIGPNCDACVRECAAAGHPYRKQLRNGQHHMCGTIL